MAEIEAEDLGRESEIEGLMLVEGSHVDQAVEPVAETSVEPGPEVENSRLRPQDGGQLEEECGSAGLARPPVQMGAGKEQQLTEVEAEPAHSPVQAGAWEE